HAWSAGTALFGALALIALTLAAIGCYSTLSLTVSQRTTEIGVRMAMGAAPSDIRRMVLLSGMTPVAIGILTGIGASVPLTRLAASAVFGIAAADAVSIGGAATLIGVVSIAACLIPTARALRTQPASALRCL